MADDAAALSKQRIVAAADGLAAFSKGVMDEVNGLNQALNQLTPRWNGNLANQFPTELNNRLAQPLTPMMATIADAERALRDLPGAIDVANGHIQDIADARQPVTVVVPNSYAAGATQLPGLTEQQARDQAWGYLHPLMNLKSAAAQTLQAVSQLKWTGPQAVDPTAPPGATPLGANPAGPKPTGPGPQPVAPGNKPANPGTNPAPEPKAPQTPSAPGGDTSAPSPTGADTTPTDPGSIQPVSQQPADQPTLAGDPTSTTPFTPPQPVQLPQVESAPSNPQLINPVSVPTPPLTKLPTVRTPIEPALSSSTDPVTPKFLGPNATNASTVPESVTGSSTARPGGQPQASSSTTPETAGEPSAARGGMPYMPPMGGMPGGAGKNGGGEIKPGVAESPGGPALGQRGVAGKSSPYVGVPDELRGRSADKPSGPKSGGPVRRRRTKKTSQPKPEATGEVLDEHLWRVEPPTASGT
jgi:hypothetical protein